MFVSAFCLMGRRMSECRIQSTIKLTRAQRRRIKAAAPSVDRITDADRIFFERFPDRQYRLRVSGQAEIEQNAALDDEGLFDKPGYQWFTVVCNVVPGSRIRLFFASRREIDTEVRDEFARDLFNIIASGGLRETIDAMREEKEDGDDKATT
jgi:hypothetical protein